MDLHIIVWSMFWICGILRHRKGILSLPTYYINMLFNLPAQFCLFIYSFIFVFSFISPKIFLFNDLFFQVETSYCLVASTPDAALCFQSMFYPLCHFSCFRVSSREGKLQNWNFKMLLYHQCSMSYSAFYLLLISQTQLHFECFWAADMWRRVSSG